MLCEEYSHLKAELRELIILVSISMHVKSHVGKVYGCIGYLRNWNVRFFIWCTKLQSGRIITLEFYIALFLQTVGTAVKHIRAVIRQNVGKYIKLISFKTTFWISGKHSKTWRASICFIDNYIQNYNRRESWQKEILQST